LNFVAHEVIVRFLECPEKRGFYISGGEFGIGNDVHVEVFRKETSGSF
jgi:hypothetical protein